MISRLAQPEYRIGNGLDIHQFVPTTSRKSHRSLILGGVELPGERPLLGHSDADVILHALTDAILGALALPDIGELFPDTATENRNRASTDFLNYALTQLKKHSYRLNNIDITIVAEAPHMSAHKPVIRLKLAELLQISHDCIGIKATTSEKMGALGRKEGIMCMISVLLVRQEKP